MEVKEENIPKMVLDEVKANAKRGDPDDVLKVIDEFCWKSAREKKRHMMNVGDVKGVILDKIFQEKDPLTAVELGSFLGYSAVRMARFFKKPGAMLYALEINPDYAKIVEEMVEYAGLSDKVTVIVGASSEVIPQLREKHGLKSLDFVFLDHWKPLYIPDLLKLEETGLFQKGSVVVADNVIYPGNPEYLKYVRNSPKYESTYFESTLEYRPDVVDGVEKSIYLC